MRAGILSVVVALVFGVVTSGGSGQPRAEDAIAQTMQTYAGHWNARDARALTALYTQDADYTGIGSVMARGRDEIEARYATVFAAPNDPGAMTLELSSLRFLKPDVALVDGTLGVTPTASASNGPMREQFVAVLTSDQEAWRITAFWSKRLAATR